MSVKCETFRPLRVVLLDQAIDRVMEEVNGLRERMLDDGREFEAAWRERRAALAYLLVLRNRIEVN